MKLKLKIPRFNATIDLEETLRFGNEFVGFKSNPISIAWIGTCFNNGGMITEVEFKFQLEDTGLLIESTIPVTTVIAYSKKNFLRSNFKIIIDLLKILFE